MLPSQFSMSDTRKTNICQDWRLSCSCLGAGRSRWSLEALSSPHLRLISWGNGACTAILLVYPPLLNSFGARWQISSTFELRDAEFLECHENQQLGREERPKLVPPLRNAVIAHLSHSERQQPAGQSSQVMGNLWAQMEPWNTHSLCYLVLS